MSTDPAFPAPQALASAGLVLAANRGELTAAGRRLIEAHRLAQVGVRTSLLREITPLWPALDPTRLDATATPWLRLVTRAVLDHREQSIRLADQFYGAFRALQTGIVANPWGAVAAVGVLTAVTTALTVTGPVGIKSRTARGTPLDDAVRMAFVDVGGAAARLALDGGRTGLVDTVTRDEEAVGWARVTDTDPCYFCAMLAGRGYAYKSRESATLADRGRFHDHCACVAVPAFARDQPMTERSQRFEQLYADATGDVDGPEKVRAFRRAYENRRTAA